ncbi:MAG: MBL fold metallo-hydrolase [Candidatus Bathyarchaeota archaeon]|nr:MBL fold metallo-hydrolase [Candidatus Bathyarchaeota archaeon]
MHTKKIGDNLFLIDLETGGFQHLIASYVLKGAKTIIVETGPTSSITHLLSSLNKIGVATTDVAYVALSHVHLDHGGGTGTLLKLLPNAKIIVHPRGAAHLINPQKLWLQSQAVLGYVAEIYGKPEPVAEDKIIPAAEGMVFEAENTLGLKVVETLGHAVHNLSFFETLNKGVFTGDAAGIYLNEFNVVIPTSPPPFRLDIALASLEKLIRLNPKFLYYSHFGKASNAVQRLKDYALQLKQWASIAEEGTAKGQSFEAIRDRILAEDEAMRKIAPYLKAHPIFMKTAIENSVRGFTEAASKTKT